MQLTWRLCRRAIRRWHLNNLMLPFRESAYKEYVCVQIMKTWGVKRFAGDDLC